MKPVKYCLVLVFFLLAGCGPTVQIVNHPKPELKVDFSPFEEGDCPPGQSGYRKCLEDSPLYSLGCDFIQPTSELLGGLTPVYPMAKCIYRPYDHPDVSDPYNIPESEYIYRSGGPMLELIHYVIKLDGEFILIKNPEEFRATFSPVETQNEALSFSLALNNVYAGYGSEVNKKFRYYVKELEDTFVEKVNDDFVVHAFAYQFFGCGPHYTYAFDIKVTVDGQVEEMARVKIFNDPAQDDLCVD